MTDEQTQMNRWRWQRAYYIATIIIAGWAGFGFIFSIWSSQSTSLTLTKIQEGLNMLSSPLIHFYDHEWYPKNWYGSEDPCNRFPIGVRTTYKNDSNIPVRIVVATPKIFYGEKEIDDVVKK